MSPTLPACHPAPPRVRRAAGWPARPHRRPRSPPPLRRTRPSGMELAALVAFGSAPAAPVDLPRLRTRRHLALFCAEGGQDLCLLALGHLEVVHGVDKFLTDFVEHLG